MIKSTTKLSLALFPKLALITLLTSSTKDALSLIFFAYSTILGWCYYGEKCCTYVFGEKSVGLYRVIYIVFVMLGTMVSLDLVWSAADTFNGLMAIPNLIALLLLTGVIVSETKDFKAKRKSGELP